MNDLHHAAGARWERAVAAVVCGDEVIAGCQCDRGERRDAAGIERGRTEGVCRGVEAAADDSRYSISERHRAGGVPLPPPFVTVAVKVTGTPAGSVRSSGFDEVTLTPTPLSPCTETSVEPLTYRLSHRDR